MGFIGAFTALFAATIAVAQNDIKRVLAYSTISQLGFMIAALGVGAYVAAAFHLVTHAFFKALLFLGSGSVIHGMEHGVLHTGQHMDPQDMFNMGGLRKKMPVTFWTFLIGGFALSGFPIITAGFWSKDEILAETFNGGHWLSFVVLALAALLTAFYTMRQITLTFLGEPRTHCSRTCPGDQMDDDPPLVVLAVFAVAVGWAGIPRAFPLLGGLNLSWFQDFVGTMVGEGEAAGHSLRALVNLAGGGPGRAVPGLAGLPQDASRDTGPGQEEPARAAHRPASASITSMRFTSFLFVRPAIWLADVFTSEWMDRGVIDGTLHAIGRFFLWLGSFFRNVIDLPVWNRGWGCVGAGNAPVWIFDEGGADRPHPTVHDYRAGHCGGPGTAVLLPAGFGLIREI